MAEKSLVEMRGIWKSFGAVQALQDVDLKLYLNEVLGLIGDNAAGKSTLMKILSGAYLPDNGEIFIEGERVNIKAPEDARALGIEMVYQDFALANKQDISSNIFMGREIRMGGIGRLLNMYDRRRMDAESEALLERLKIQVDSVRLKVERLSGGQRQAVAIARSMAFNAKVVIMDEPTASLSVSAIGKVLELVKQLKDHGISVIFISHRLEDILHVSDRIMILRRGRRVGDLKNEGLKIMDLVEYMVGARDDFA
jgi:ABC-type sugar transport system ATPase subunit